MRQRFTIAALFFTGLMLIFPVLVSGQSAMGIWSPGIFLGYGWWQSLTVDRTDTAHVVWYGVIRPDNETTSALDEDLLIYRRRSFAGEWTEPIDVYNPGRGGLTVRNALTVTSDGRLGVYFRSDFRHLFGVAPATAANNAVNWHEPIPLALGYYMSLLADHNDVFHAVSAGSPIGGSGEVPVQNLESNVCSFCSDVIYRRSVDGRNWSIPANLTNNHKGADKLEIWQSRSGRLYLNWDSGSDWYIGRGLPEDVRLIYSDDSGATWSEQIVISGDEDNLYQNPMQGEFAELEDGTLLAVWRYSSGPDQFIYSQLSNDSGLTWTDPEPIPGILARDTNETPLDDYELVTDKLGNAHLFAVVNTTYANRSSLVEVEFRQGQWRPEQLIYEASPARIPEWPQASIGPQNDIHLTWFVRVSNTQTPPAPRPGQVPLEVFYAHRSATMPEQPTQAFLPTQTPLPTVAVAVQLEPTITPYPTVVASDTDVTPTTSDIYASQIVLLALAVSALFCGLVAAIYRFGPR